MHAFSCIRFILNFSREIPMNNSSFQLKSFTNAPLETFLILLTLYGGSRSSMGVIFLRVRHVRNGPLWHFFYTWDTYFYGQGVISLLPKMTPRSFFDGGGGFVIRRNTGRHMCKRSLEIVWPTTGLPFHRNFVDLLKAPFKHRYGVSLIG